jgi:hypothetical protein
MCQNDVDENLLKALRVGCLLQYVMAKLGLQAYLDLLDTYERIYAPYYTSLTIGKFMLLKYDM